MAKSSNSGGLCPKASGFSGIALMVLVFYVLFMVWDSHRRSAFMSDLPSGARLLSSNSGYNPGTQCKSISVSSGAKDHGDTVNFLLDGHPVYDSPSARGINVVAIDPLTQEVIGRSSYDLLEDATSANRALSSDLGHLLPGVLVLLGVKDTGLEYLDESSLNGLRELGSSITKGNFQEGLALIGVKGGAAIAEGQGGFAQVGGVVPCHGGALLRPVALRGSEAPPAGESLDVSLDEPSANGQTDQPDVAVDQPVDEPEVEQPPDRAQPEEAAKEETSIEKDHSRPIEGSPETTYRCVGGQGDRSCLFKNLYYHKGRFVMYVLEGPKEHIEVFRADKYEGLWKPDIEVMSSESSIEKKLKKFAVIEERGLSVQFNPLFHHNIGHALFDGLYPAFVATVKLGVQDRPFLPVVAVDPGCFEEHATGALQNGDLVEAYLPHEKYGRTLRAVRARISKAAKTAAKDPECKWQKDMDHNGLDLGSQPVGGQDNQKSACIRACSLTFGCKAGVIFADVCYLKGSGGHEFPVGDRLLCKFKGDGPKANVGVTPEVQRGFEGEIKEYTIPDAWITGKVRRRCMSEGIYQMFGGVGEMRRLFELERDCRNYPNLLVRFEEVVIGVGGAGNMVADRSGAIGGSLAPHNAMIQFRDRMLRSYGLPVRRGVKPLSPDKDIHVIIISNKRFMQEDRRALDVIKDNLNHRGGVKVEFVDWGRIGGGDPANKFREHLRKTQKADIYVSSIGTALQYVPFMQDGKVYIAIGAVWMRSKQYFPTFMEQQLAGGGTPYLRTLYADPGGVLRHKLPHVPLGEDGFFAGVNGTLVSELMEEAQVLVRKGFEIPVSPEENLSVEAKILVELCRRDPSSCKTMNDNRNGRVYECALLLWNEAVVYEVGPWRKGSMCGSSHHKLLRQLRKEHGLPGYGAPSS